MTDENSPRDNLRVQIPLVDPGGPIEWLPNETIYSISSRWHALSGGVSHKQTARLLFGRNRGGFPHDLPGGIGYFAAAFDGRLGQAEDIIFQRTALPLIIAFRSEHVRTQALTAMAQGAIGGLKTSLGLPASRLGASLPLKACSTCMQADRFLWGTPYWHLEHQLPGVWFCIKHKSFLLVSASSQSGQARYQWLLPQLDDLAQPNTSISEIDESWPLALKISEFLSELWKMSVKGPVSIMVLASALRTRLIARGLALPTGRLKASQASRQFHQFTQSIGSIRDWSGVASSEAAAYSQIHSLLAAHENSHPIRVAVALAWLFVDWNDFIAACRSESPTPVFDSGSKASGAEDASQKESLAMLVRAGESVSEAARKCGIQVATAQAWLVQQGVAVPKRPSIMKGDARERAIDALRQGADKAAVCEETGWSSSSIERLLRTELGLKVAWKEARYRRDRDCSRERWLIALNEFDGNTRAARVVTSSAYAWLYRNDRRWLLDANQTVRRPRTSSGLRVDWVQRDLEFLGAARKAVDAILSEGSEKPISLMEILRRVPELKAKYRRIQDLPRTQQFLRSARKPRRDGLFTSGGEGS
ncbi:MAG: TniQ family protein [Planctomycetales bacterium]|nr:TniQ family protein [Planctomycetales bacterium]